MDRFKIMDLIWVYPLHFLFTWHIKNSGNCLKLSIILSPSFVVSLMYAYESAYIFLCIGVITKFSNLQYISYISAPRFPYWGIYLYYSASGQFVNYSCWYVFKLWIIIFRNFQNCKSTEQWFAQPLCAIRSCEYYHVCLHSLYISHLCASKFTSFHHSK